MATVGAVTSGLTATVKTAAYQSLPNDLVLANATTAAFTVTLPASPIVGTTVAVKKTDTSANVVTVVGYASSTIDGDPSALLASQDSAATFTFDGANWQVSSTAVLNTSVSASVGASSAYDAIYTPPYTSGLWYDRRSGSAQPNYPVGNMTLSTSTIYYVPAYLTKSISISQLAILMYGTAPTAGSTVRLGAYTCTAVGAPGTLVKDFGVLSLGSTANTFLFLSGFPATVLPKGWVYFAMSFNSVASGSLASFNYPSTPVPSQGIPTSALNYINMASYGVGSGYTSYSETGDASASPLPATSAGTARLTTLGSVIPSTPMIWYQIA